MKKPSLLGECAAEFTGTMILTFFICGAVNCAVLTGALVGLMQVALVCGLGVTVGIYVTAAVSGAHLNPAITLAFAAWRGFPKAKIVPYILSQVIGGFAAGMLCYAIFHGLLTDFEAAKHLVRGGPGSELSAMMFGEYWPNPTATLSGTTHPLPVSLLTAFLAEGVGTMILAGAIFAFTEKRNTVTPQWMTPLAIGLTVTILISLFGPLTQAGFNPARDFGPRLAAYLLGWGSVAIPMPNGGFFVVYILAPIVGAQVGSALYQTCLRSHLAPVEEESLSVERELVEVR
jgi:glycerol uptake facilitator protein